MMYLRRLMILGSLGWLLTNVFIPEVQAFKCMTQPTMPTALSPTWLQRDITYVLDHPTEQILEGVSNEEVFKVLRASFKVWEAGVPTRPANGVGCVATEKTDLHFSEKTYTQQQYLAEKNNFLGYHPELGEDHNANFLVFQKGNWNNGSGPETIALTTVKYNIYTSKIVDVDMEFNAVNYKFQIKPDKPDLGYTDLQNVAVHEMGHFIGLDHPPLTQADAPQTTMYYAVLDPQETLKRSLHCDDVQGLLFKYPAGQPTNNCLTPPEAACGYCIGANTPPAPPPSPSSNNNNDNSTTSGESHGCSCDLLASTRAPFSHGLLSWSWLAAGYLGLYLMSKFLLRGRFKP